MFRFIIGLLRLIRLPNIFTAISNVWAGMVVAGSVFPATAHIIFGSVASAALYSGGMALNDYFDLKRDKKERPNRVLPSGVIKPSIALSFGILLLMAGIVCGFMISASAGVICSVIALSAFLYDSLFKRWFITAIIFMPLCRAFNWELGLNIGGAFPKEFIIFPVIIFIYIAITTALARLENDKPALRKIVKTGILIIPLIDGLLVFMNGYYWQAGIIASLMIPALVLGIIFEMT
ncbi:MAG: UbiA family prenyltransferase [Planctomycetes bacterium]|nr:UbiA family prenyltransferase [Planctomycetota bacterium]